MIGSMMDATFHLWDRMNLIMKRLTSISTILMSVDSRGWDLWHEFVFNAGAEMAIRLCSAAAASMVAVGLAIYSYFRKIKWL